MSRVEAYYRRAPLFLQTVLISAYGYTLRRERYGREYGQYMRFLRDFNVRPRGRQEEYQAKELQRLLQYVVTNSTFYRDLYDGIDVRAIRSVEDLRVLPAVTKEMLRANINDAVTVPRDQAIEGHTGGTTGKSLIVYYTKLDLQRRMATLDYFKEKHGFVHLKMRRATFNGKHLVPPRPRQPVYWRYNMPGKQMLYSTFHLTEEALPHYVRSLNRFRPHALDGFFSSIYEVASYIERHNVPLEFTPVAIFPTSETVTLREKEVIERVFKAKVRDQYASSEGAPFITECTAGRLHLDLSSGVFEHPFPGSNEVVVTSFTTYGTPLIRYRIGDSVEMDHSGEPCPCGSPAPIAKSITGRAVDFIVASNGARVNLGNVANVFKNVPNAVVKAQLVQSELGAVTVRLVCDSDLYKPQHDRLILTELHAKFGDDMRITLEKVEDIERERSGKHRLVINTLAKREEATTHP